MAGPVPEMEVYRFCCFLVRYVSCDTHHQVWNGVLTMHVLHQHVSGYIGYGFPGASHVSAKGLVRPHDLVYQQGDIIHLDTGFNYVGFASDWQKVAYVLRAGEDDVPDGLKVALRNAGVAQQAMLAAPRPGMTGREATIATMALLEGVDFLPSLYSHAIGYQGHALGPSINARNMVLGPAPGYGDTPRDSVLRPGSYRSIELSATTAIPEWNGETLTIPFEDDAHLTDEGYMLFRPPQTSWYLIR